MTNPDDFAPIAPGCPIPIPADACQDVPSHLWATGDAIDYDDGQTHLRATLVAPCEAQPGMWSCDLPGVVLDERYFRRAD